MTLNELIERLKQYRKEIGGDAKVLLMTQQNWPFENSIYGLASAAEIQQAAMEESEYDDEEEFADDTEADPNLYIVEGGQLGYGTKTAWDAAH